MLTIGQVASRAGLRTSAIRYYEAQGLLPKPMRQGGKRTYAPSILERLAVIELAKSAGFALSDIRTLLSSVETGNPGTLWRRQVPAKVAAIDEHMQRLVEMKDLQAKLESCSCATLEDCGRAFIKARSK